LAGPVIFRRVVISGPSMVPTLRPGDLVLARYGARTRPGDVVLARYRARPDRIVVKRAVRAEDGGWWLASDNPFAEGAADSARFGPVPRENIVAVVLVRYWPLRRGQPRRVPD